MANITLTNLPTVTSLNGTEPLLGVQSSSSVQITTEQIATYTLGLVGIGVPVTVSNGGTGDTTLTQYGLMFGNGTNPVGTVTPPAGSNYVLVASAGSAPSWQPTIPVSAGVDSVAFGTTGLTPVAATAGVVSVAFGSTPTAAGIYSPATNQIALSTASVQRLLIDSSGNVGIGTSSPTAKLHVLGNNGTNGTSAFFSISSSNSGIAMVNNGTIGGIQGQTTPTGTNTDIYINANGGNVGIGTSSPTIRLQVSGSIGNLNNSQTVPTPDNGSVPVNLISNNFSSGSGETNFWNTAATITGGIRLMQVTGTGTYNDMAWFQKNLALFYTGNTERMRIDSSGNVMVGTTTARGILTVAQNNPTGISSELSNLNTASNTTKFTQIQFSGYDTVSTYKPAGQIIVNPADGNYVSAYMAFSTRVSDALSERMRIDASGNVGIGTSSPSSYGKLAVSGNLYAGDTTTNNDGTITIGSSGAGSVAITRTGTGATNSSLTFSTTFSTLQERMRIDSSGNVGIGTSSPSYLLDVQNTSTAVDYIAGRFLSSAAVSGESHTWLKVEKSSTYGGAIGGYLSQGVGSGLLFGTQNASATPTEAMRITNAGNVGIGTSSPSTKLNVYTGSATNTLIRAQNTAGYIDFGALSTGAVYGGYSTGGIYTIGTSDSNPVLMYTAGTERMRIDSSGNVSIGPSGTTTGANLITNAQITGATTAYVHYNVGVVQSGVTGAAYSYTSSIGLAASVTTNEVDHFIASPQSGGAGSTISIQVGFNASSTLGIGGAATVTTAYGFYGGIASGANRWNLYMGGSANNYMAGALGVGTTTVGVAGSINAIGAITFQTTTNNQSYTTTGAGTITISSGTAGSINNMSIGATTASTGAFTTVTAPTMYGGTTSSSTLTLQSTSGAGTTDSVVVKTGNNGAVTAATFNTAGVPLATNWYNTTTQTATNTATLTAAQITGPFLLSTPTAAAAYTLPLASAVDTALGTPAAGTGWEFVIFTNAAFVVTVTTNTGWTLVGTMTTGGTATSFARFRAYRTGTSAYTLYRIS